MRSCELTIITRSGASQSTFRAEGTIEKALKGERVRYRIEGDEGELIFLQNSLTMSRRGKCGLKATFSEGEQTEMVLSQAELCGSIPVRTSKYLFQKQETKLIVELCYELGGADNIQTFSLKILVSFSEEK